MAIHDTQSSASNEVDHEIGNSENAKSKDWYRLATLAGEQGEIFDEELHSRNRRLWNRWALGSLSEDTLHATRDNQILDRKLLNEISEETLLSLFRERGLSTIPTAYEKIDFSNTVWTTSADFNGFIFPLPVSFQGTIFDDDVDFTNAKFLDDAFFQDACFNGTAFFQNVSFFETCSLNATKFHDTAVFDGSTFCGGAFFDNAHFCDFSGFDGCKFKCEASYNSAEFIEAVSFDGTAFDGDVGFLKAVFHDSASFLDVSFLAGADFTDSYFAEMSFFERASFLDQVRFHNTVFGKIVLFENVRFSATVSFTNAVFEDDVPIFFGATFQDGVEFTGAQWPPLINTRRASEKMSMAYGALKRAMLAVGRDDLAQEFYILELRSLRYCVSPTTMVAIFIYDVVSRFGTSIARPIFLALLVALMSCTLYHSILPGISYLQAMQITISAFLGPFGNMDRITATLAAGSQSLTTVLMLGDVQFLMGVCLTFLIAQAFRYRFRIRRLQ